MIKTTEHVILGSILLDLQKKILSLPTEVYSLMVDKDKARKMSEELYNIIKDDPDVTYLVALAVNLSAMLGAIKEEGE